MKSHLRLSLKMLVLCFSLFSASAFAEPAFVEVEALTKAHAMPHELSQQPGPKYVFRLKEFPNQPVMVFSVRALFANGIMKMGDLQPNQKQLYMGSTGYLPGETVVFCFTNEDHSFEYEFPFIPQPMLAESNDGSLTIEAQLIQLQSTAYKLDIGGLKEGEKYTFHTASGQEISETEMVFSKHTRLEYTPGVLGKEGGQGIVTITDSRGRKVKIHLPWGSELMRFKEKPMAYSP
jgi:hypothetical protein